MNSKKVVLIDVGLKAYADVLRLQESLFEARQNGKALDHIIMCEHFPVYTLGKRDCEADIISPRSKIEKDGIAIIQTNRGGRITYHGPGQLVVYFIMGLASYARGIKGFVSLVEDTAAAFLKSYGLVPSKKSEYPGIWIGDKKIAAVGLHVSNGVTMHGMAVNIAADMKHYKHIIPCGIKGHGITSLDKELGRKIGMANARREMKNSIERTFRCRFVRKTY